MTMTTTVVLYQAKPECAEENQRLIEAVFAELNEREPEGFTYKVFRLEDGVSFIHVVIEHDVDNPNSLQAVPAFQAFEADIADRCDVPPSGHERHHRRRLPLTSVDACDRRRWLRPHRGECVRVGISPHVAR
jgi:hypothetical protein